MRIRAFAAWRLRDGAAVADPTGHLPGTGWRHWTNGSLVLAFAPRDEGATVSDPPALILGDDAEFDPRVPDRNIANGAVIRVDAKAGAIVVHTSIVGLPPVYRHQRGDALSMGSDLHLMSRLPGASFEFDPVGLHELARFGFPVGQRTLFKGVDLLPAGRRLEFTSAGAVHLSRSWSLPERPPLDAQSFIEEQVSAFTDAMRRIETDRTFISLTAGLDTRAVFATLASEGRLPPAVTMSGARRSLDARIASRLAHSYGIEHTVVTFGAAFRESLPSLVETTSRLSGGVSSLGQSPEVHLYRQLSGRFDARLSGNLGNQVGRGGTEGVSVRGADPRILRGEPPRHEERHWLLVKLGGDQRSRIEFILEAEIAYSSVGNYSVGNHFAVQQTPYADRALIETLASMPDGPSSPSGSMLRMRARDLRHRFLGEPASASFQRTLVQRLGGAAAEIPINWGWRPSGGVSPVGFAMGMATFVGMVARAKGLEDGVMRRPLEWSGLPALHDFHETRRWLREDLQSYVRETVLSSRQGTGDLFDRSRLGRTLDEHFSGTHDHYQTVCLALDVALAHQQFIAR